MNISIVYKKAQIMADLSTIRLIISTDVNTLEEFSVIACEQGNIDVIDFLFQYFSEHINIETMIYNACYANENSLECIQLLCSFLKKPLSDNYKHSLLMNIIDSNCSLDLLLFIWKELKQPITEKLTQTNIYGDTLLIMACIKNNNKFINFILDQIKYNNQIDKKSIILKQNNNRFTCLTILIQNNNVDIVDDILKMFNFNDLIDILNINGDSYIGLITSKEMLQLLTDYYIELYKYFIRKNSKTYVDNSTSPIPTDTDEYPIEILSYED